MECDQRVAQNLRDAGCDEGLIRSFAKIGGEAPDEMRNRRQERLLAEHRRKLLDALHWDRFRLDCLDYLLFCLRKGGRDDEKDVGAAAGFPGDGPGSVE
ncbi:MAG: hypothetical protein IJ240_07860 [Clostridia bacterium]|nr:hypothetical protein [Clostridia bacterium]